MSVRFGREKNAAVPDTAGILPHDTIVFLGSSENETDKYMSEKLGKQTIRTIDESQSKSSTSGSVSTSFKKQARDLLDAAEIAKLNNKDCIVVIRGKDPFLLKKLEFNEHPNYKKTGDYDRSRIVDEVYLEAHFKCQNKETFEEDQIRGEEEHQKEVAIDQQKNQNKKKSKPVTNGKDLADAVGVPEEKLSDAMKKAKSVDPDDYEEDAGASAAKTTAADAYEFDLGEEEEVSTAPVLKEEDNTDGKAEAEPETSPESEEDSWSFF